MKGRRVLIWSYQPDTVVDIAILCKDIFSTHFLLQVWVIYIYGSINLEVTDINAKHHRPVSNLRLQNYSSNGSILNTSTWYLHWNAGKIIKMWLMCELKLPPTKHLLGLWNAPLFLSQSEELELPPPFCRLFLFLAMIPVFMRPYIYTITALYLHVCSTLMVTSPWPHCTQCLFLFLESPRHYTDIL